MDHVVVPPGDGKSFWFGGQGAIFKVPGADTGGSFAIIEHPTDPGRLVPPHVHTREDELSYVVEGEFGVRVGDQVFNAATGAYIYKPRGIPHTFWNAGTTPARLIEIIWPAGFEKFFEELAELYRGAPDPGQITALAERYGCSYSMDWVPELTAKYNLKLLGQ